MTFHFRSIIVFWIFITRHQMCLYDVFSANKTSFQTKLWSFLLGGYSENVYVFFRFIGFQFLPVSLQCYFVVSFLLCVFNIET